MGVLAHRLCTLDRSLVPPSTQAEPLLGELAMSRKKESERESETQHPKKMPFILATYVYASSQGQRTHSAWTNVCDPNFWTI
jgi:hypothetical protein